MDGCQSACGATTMSTLAQRNDHVPEETVIRKALIRFKRQGFALDPDDQDHREAYMTLKKTVLARVTGKNVVQALETAKELASQGSSSMQANEALSAALLEELHPADPPPARRRPAAGPPPVRRPVLEANQRGAFLEELHQVEPCMTWLDAQNRRNLFLAPHESGQQYFMTMHIETDAGDIRIVEGVSQSEQGLIIIARLHEESDEWVLLNGKTKDAPRSHSMFISSPQLPSTGHRRHGSHRRRQPQAPFIKHVIRVVRTEVTIRPADEIRLRLLPTLADLCPDLPDFTCLVADTFSCPPALMGQGAREEIRLRMSSGQCDSPFRNTTAMKWRTCETCDEQTWKMQKCGGCRLAHYCSKACQLQNWRSGHKYHCSPEQPLPKGRMYISIHHQFCCLTDICCFSRHGADSALAASRATLA